MGLSFVLVNGMYHIGIAVKNLDEAIVLYRDVLGLKLEGVHVLAERKVRVAFFSTGGDTQIELLEPLDSESPIAKFLENRGEGVHHIALRVEDIEAAMRELRGKGLVFVDDKPRLGASGAKVAFIHPKSTRGVLLELVMK